ncbi:MAG: MauE/DoxX family redox-associated membrane protein [Phycisphaerales bacterium]
MAIVFTETTIGLLLAANVLPGRAAAAALGMILIFSVVLLRAVVVSAPPACGCAGLIGLLGKTFETAEMILIRNAVLTKWQRSISSMRAVAAGPAFHRSWHEVQRALGDRVDEGLVRSATFVICDGPSRAAHPVPHARNTFDSCG